MIALGSDHAGIHLKQAVLAHLREKGVPAQDLGCFDGEAVDYPLYGQKVAESVAAGQYELGVVFCGTGIGISLAANKVPGIRCAVCTDVYSAKMTRLHNDANMLALGERVTGVGLALEIVDAFLSTSFEGGRHARRVEQIAQIEQKYQGACGAGNE